MVADLVERFERDRKACPARSYGGVATRSRRVFLSSDYKEEQLLAAKAPHERESLKRTIAATDAQIDALVYELYSLSGEEVRITGGTQ